MNTSDGSDKKFVSATLIGLIFGMISFSLTLTIIIPIHSIYLAIPIEFLMSKIFGDSWFLIGFSTSLILVLILLIIIIYFISKLSFYRSQSYDNWKFTLILFFSVTSLIIHPLFFCLSFAPEWTGLSDGQAVMNLLRSFPISSLSLILLGLIIDHYFERREVS